MKNRTSKIMGILVTLALLVSLFAFAIPVSAGTLTWSTQATPSAAAFQVAPALLAGMDSSLVTPVGDGTTVFAVDTFAGAGTDVVYKSTNGGQTWTASSVNPWAAVAIAAIVVSPNFATDNTVIVAAGNLVYISSNGGSTFAQLGGAVAAGEVITSLAISPTYNGSGEIMVGTTNAIPATYGNVYIWMRAGVLNWTAQALAEDISAVAFSPSFPVDSTILAVGSHANRGFTLPAIADAVTITGGALDSGVVRIHAGAAGVTLTGTATYNAATGVWTTPTAGDTVIITATAITSAGSWTTNLGTSAIAVTAGTAALAGATRLHTKVSTIAWDYTATPPVYINAAAGVGDALAIVSSSMAIASNYNGAVPAARLVFVATISGVATDNIYQLRGTTVTSFNSPAVGGDNLFASLAYAGTSTGGNLFAAESATTNIYRCANPTATVGFLLSLATTPPTGAANASVAFVTTADGTKVFVGTTGAESAVNVSDDGGVNFYQTGMIDTVLNTITDFQTSPAYATDLTAFMVTEDGAATIDSVWKTINGGTTWVRVLALATTNNAGIVRISPAFATDRTVYFAETGAGTSAIRFSNDVGVTWLVRATTVGINDLLVKDANNIYVASNATGVVARSSNQGWTWSNSALTGAASVWKLALSGNAVLAGANAGQVFLSADGITYTRQGGAAGIGGGNVGAVAFDANYATNNTIYAAGTLAGLFRFVVGTSAAWTATIDGAITGAGNIRGIVTTPEGALYAANFAVGGGVIRSLYPTNAIATVGATFEAVGAGDGLTATYTLNSLVYTAGSNVLFAIENSGGAGANRVVTYTDTFSTVKPELTSAPADGAVSRDLGFLPIAWDAVTSATGYDYQVSLRSDFSGAAIVPVAAPVTNARPVQIAEGAVHYWRVRISTPVVGPWGDARTIKSAINTVVNAPAPAYPAGTAVINVPVNPMFNWGELTFATGYELQIAKSSDFATASLIVNNTGANALGKITSFTPTTALENNTPYYWRVRGISATGATDWSATVGFRTVAVPTTTTPPPTTVTTITTTQPPATTITITQPPATTTTNVVQETSPGWIYAIIVVGAVLIIAVIVLIVRTRRVV